MHSKVYHNILRKKDLKSPILHSEQRLVLWQELYVYIFNFQIRQ